MSTAQAKFDSIGKEIEGATASRLFGKPCYKLNKKAFTCFFENQMVFKLTGEPHEEALQLEGAKLFDPSGRGSAMKEWVQVPFKHKEYWYRFAQEAARYVTSEPTSS